jgi:hypothetical protein
VLSHETPGAQFSDGYMIEDAALGTAPRKRHQGHATRSIAGARLYDVTYSIDADGLRVAPPVSAESAGRCILFFGDSFTFGEGLEDSETLPYQVGIRSSGYYKTYNFGFHGYGPNQMLAEIERGIVGRDVDCVPDAAIYTAIPGHVARVAGKIPYGQHGPRYQLSGDGTPRLIGRFDDKKESSRLVEAVRRQAVKSAMYRKLQNRTPEFLEEDTRLMVAIIRKSSDLLAEEFPGIKFHVIMWVVGTDDQDLYPKVQVALRHANISVHRVEDILPGYTVSARSPKYVLSPSDLHPNALANRLLADYVLTTIIGRTPSY